MNSYCSFKCISNTKKMKTKITFIFFLLFTLTYFAQTNPCGTVVNDTFIGTGALPSEWTEYNTSGSVTVTDGKLKFEHSNQKPAAYRTITPITSNANFSFEVNASRNSVNCQIHLVSSTGKHLTTISVGKGTASIKIATAMENGVPGGFVEGTPQVTLIKDTDYKISTKIDFTTQKVNFYNDGALVYEGAPFLEAAEDIAKLDIQLLYMYSNTGQFYFDNITFFTSEAHQLLSEEIIIANAMLDTAVIGTNSREYSQNDYDVFKTAINTAISVEQNCSASQSEVNQALENLKGAMVNFKASAVPFDGTIDIDALDIEQKIVMMGGDMERNAPALLDAPDPQEIVDWYFKDIPLNTFRVKYDKKQEMTEGVVDMDGTYAEQVMSMKLILKTNPNIKFFATMKSDYNGYSQGNRNNLPTFIYDYDVTEGVTTGTKSFDGVKYGRFLADYIEYMSDNEVPISYLSTSKEWTQVMTAARAKMAIESLISNLAARGIAMPLIVDSGAWSLNQGIQTVNTYISNNVDQYAYAYSAHKYGGNNTWSQYGNAVKKTGKMFFNDEASHGAGGQITEWEVPIAGTLDKYADKCDGYASGLNGEMLFEVWMKNTNFNQYYSRPVVFTATESRRMRSYFIFKKFAENAVDANYVNQALNKFEDVSSMAFVKDNKMALWIVNSSESDYSGFSINVSNLGLKEGMKVQQVYWDDATAIEGAEINITSNANNQFKANIAPLSISCFVIDINSELSTNNHQISNVNIYPNPVADKLMISAPNAAFKQYTIYNLNGQVMSRSKINTKEIEVNVTKLSTGIYLLKLDVDQTSETHKIIKK